MKDNKEIGNGHIKGQRQERRNYISADREE